MAMSSADMVILGVSLIMPAIFGLGILVPLWIDSRRRCKKLPA